MIYDMWFIYTKRCLGLTKSVECGEHELLYILQVYILSCTGIHILHLCFTMIYMLFINGKIKYSQKQTNEPVGVGMGVQGWEGAVEEVACHNHSLQGASCIPH